MKASSRNKLLSIVFALFLGLTCMMPTTMANPLLSSLDDVELQPYQAVIEKINGEYGYEVIAINDPIELLQYISDNDITLEEFGNEVELLASASSEAEQSDTDIYVDVHLDGDFSFKSEDTILIPHDQDSEPSLSVLPFRENDKMRAIYLSDYSEDHRWTHNISPYGTFMGYIYVLSTISTNTDTVPPTITYANVKLFGHGATTGYVGYFEASKFTTSLSSDRKSHTVSFQGNWVTFSGLKLTALYTYHVTFYAPSF